MTATSPMSALAEALIYRARMSDTPRGNAQAALRREIMQGDRSLHPSTLQEAKAAHARLMACRIEDMPPAVEDLSLLIDVIAMRHGCSARADAWRLVGINPNRGRSLLGQNAGAIDWPIWFTCRHAALEV